MIEAVEESALAREESAAPVPAPAFPALDPRDDTLDVPVPFPCADGLLGPATAFIASLFFAPRDDTLAFDSSALNFDEAAVDVVDILPEVPD